MSRLNEFWSVLRSLHRCLIFMDMYIDEICFIMSALWEAFSAWPWSSRSARTAGNCSVMTERALIVSFLKMFTCEKISEIFVSSLRILSAILITFTTPLFGCISPPWSLSDHKWKCHHTTIGTVPSPTPKSRFLPSLCRIRQGSEKSKVNTETLKAAHSTLGGKFYMVGDTVHFKGQTRYW